VGHYSQRQLHDHNKLTTACHSSLSIIYPPPSTLRVIAVEAETTEENAGQRHSQPAA
jgi:hypothetical protein